MFKNFAIFLCSVPQSETLLIGKLIGCTFNVRFDFFDFRSKLTVFWCCSKVVIFGNFVIPKMFFEKIAIFLCSVPQSEILLIGKLIGCTFNVRFDFDFRSKLTVFRCFFFQSLATKFRGKNSVDYYNGLLVYRQG